MSSCERYQELISRMVDDELSTKERVSLNEHIQACPDCAALYSAFSALSRQLGEDLEEVPLDLRENVMAGIRREEIRKRNRLPSIMRGVLATAACAAVIIGISLGVSPRLRDKMAASAFGSVPTANTVSREMAAATEEDAPEEDAAFYCTEAAMDRDDALDRPAEMPALGVSSAPEADMADADEAMYADTTEEAAAEEAESEEEPASAVQESIETLELDLSDRMTLDLLHEILDGEPAAELRDSLPDAPVYLLTVRSGAGTCRVSVYELDEKLYYLDPTEDALYLARLSPAEWQAFLQ